ncbi:SurA N-terminal domain-containing protein [Rhodoferax sp. 4810]|uniref:Periplasmic chaperone PpiD n=1 Tax=Thiospirillum jenense TaxID=1653858 RepID=A0A839HJ44_9GAMM|nr:SurA N-terminal domain-containing protein [Thiospirillum jenense]MBB1075448.1 SurA N-terminal domain-containing protein [Rhodoferax jenense]MBB1126827.1 SurA N-terminal domain-containing protein [Thiospirillum jenense]
MLQQIRERAQGWFAWVIIILISVPFALWGIQSYLGISSEPLAATVNDTQITEWQFNRRVQQTRQQLRDQLGAAYDPQLFGGQALREQVLARMIRETLLLDVSHTLGLAVSDQLIRGAILAEPAFQHNGQFDKATYERVLQLQGATPTAYEDDLRQRLQTMQLERAITRTAFATTADIDAAVRLLRQQRTVSFVQLPATAFMPKEAPTEAVMQKFYQDNQALFSTPEQVRVNYLQLSTAAAPANSTIDEDTLRARYTERLAEFTTPEQRHVRHILLTVPAEADAAATEAVKQRLLELRHRIVNGEDFATVAQAQSEDTSTAANGGQLGEVKLGMLDPAFEQMAFQLAPKVVSEPVRSRFGYHLIEVTAITPKIVQSFEAVRDQLAQELAKTSAEEQFFDQAERLATLTYETPDSLVPAAEALGLKIETSDWITRMTGGAGMFADPKVIAAAFSDEVLNLAHNSEVLEPDPSQMQALVLRLDEHRTAAVKPFADVREQIVNKIQERAASDAAFAAAQAMLARLQQGEEFAAVAQQFTVTSGGAVSRNSDKVPAAILDHAFTLPRPAVGQASDGAGRLGADAFVVRVTVVEDGALEATAQAEERRVLTAAQAQAHFEQVVADLQRRARIERKIAALTDNATHD